MSLSDFAPALAAPVAVVAVFVVALAVLLVLRHLLIQRLESLAAATETRLDDLLLAATRTPSLFWSVALALELALRSSPMDAAVLQFFSRAITILVVISMTLAASHVAGGAVTRALRRSSPDAGVPGLGQALARGVILVLGGMVALNMLGVEIAPLLTALGVGGLAVALALQDSLTNFFAGIHILLERPYAIGQFIKLQDGQEGHVLDIGWRTTRVRTLDDDVIVVPNSKMAGSTLLNYHMPIPRSCIVVRVGVDYGSDLEHVRAVLLDVVNAARTDLDYLLPEPAPEALVTRFGDHAVDIELRFHITDIARQRHALDELHRRVFRRFREEGIQIPFPVRRVIVEQGG